MEWPTGGGVVLGNNMCLPFRSDCLLFSGKQLSGLNSSGYVSLHASLNSPGTKFPCDHTLNIMHLKYLFACQSKSIVIHRLHCVIMRGISFFFFSQTKEMTSLVTPNVCSKHPLGP